MTESQPWTTENLEAHTRETLAFQAETQERETREMSGPWGRTRSAEKEELWGWWEEVGPAVLYAGDGPEPDWDSTEASARLIQAAPELLQMLAHLVESLEFLEERDEPEELDAARHLLARVAEDHYCQHSADGRRCGLATGHEPEGHYLMSDPLPYPDAR